MDWKERLPTSQGVERYIAPRGRDCLGTTIKGRHTLHLTLALPSQMRCSMIGGKIVERHLFSCVTWYGLTGCMLHTLAICRSQMQSIGNLGHVVSNKTCP
jgi:hypothetical protein